MSNCRVYQCESPRKKHNKKDMNAQIWLATSDCLPVMCEWLKISLRSDCEGRKSLCICSNTNPVLSGTIKVLIPWVGRRKSPAEEMLNFLYHWPLTHWELSLSQTHTAVFPFLCVFILISTPFFCKTRIQSSKYEGNSKCIKASFLWQTVLSNDTGNRAVHRLSSKTGEKLRLVNVLIYRCAPYHLTDFVVCTLVVMQDVKCSDAWQWSRLCNWMRFLFHSKSALIFKFRDRKKNGTAFPTIPWHWQRAQSEAHTQLEAQSEAFK